MTAYEGQILLYNVPDRKLVFESIRATLAKEPYRFATEKAAQHMLDACYPDMLAVNKRVLEVDAEPNIHIQGW